MKTYVLTVSRYFPKTHKRAGELTHFVEKILDEDDNKFEHPKIHTIRSNYSLWSKRVYEIQAGKAILSIRYWSGKPYNSKQIEICRLDKDSGIVVQVLGFYWGGKDIVSVIEKPFIIPNDATGIPPIIPLDILAKNDGLSIEDFKEWFRKYDLSKPMAIIHFTSFRY